jgi:hypothetical protein
MARERRSLRDWGIAAPGDRAAQSIGAGLDALGYLEEGAAALMCLADRADRRVILVRAAGIRTLADWVRIFGLSEDQLEHAFPRPHGELLFYRIAIPVWRAATIGGPVREAWLTAKAIVQ